MVANRKLLDIGLQQYTCTAKHLIPAIPKKKSLTQLGLFLYICEMIFEPSTEPLKRDYPMLKNVEEFKNLTDNQLLFVWYYACKSSPFYTVKPKERVLSVFEKMPEFAKSLESHEYDKYIDRQFPTTIAEAIKRMSKFEPKKREIANAINDRILDDCREIAEIDFSDYSELEDKKVVLDMKLNIAKNLPSIIDAAEGGYGTRKKEREQEKKELNVFESD